MQTNKKQIHIESASITRCQLHKINYFKAEPLQSCLFMYLNEKQQQKINK